MLILYIYAIYSFLFAQIADSFKLSLIDKNGRISSFQKPLHIDADLTSKDLKDRLTKRLDQYLRKPQQQNEPNLINIISKAANTDKNDDDDDNDMNEFRSIIKPSPVVYSDGRYILDFDKIDEKDVEAVTYKPENDSEYLDTEKNFQDYYDFVSNTDRLRSVAKDKLTKKQIKALTEYLKRKTSLRKYNQILLGDKKEYRTKDFSSSSDEEHHNHNIRVPVKRFKVITNSDRETKVYTYKGSSSSEEAHQKMKKKKHEHYSSYHSESSHESSDRNDRSDESYEYSKQKNDIDSFSDENPKKRKTKASEESSEYDDDEFYLQGNALVNFKPKNRADNVDADSDDDWRRRLPHFLPKRYHWEAEDMRDLGYFWFNGPRGKYPYPKRID